MADIIICPNCNQKITVTEALSKQLQIEVEQKFHKLRKKQELQQLELTKREQILKTQKNNIDKQLAQKAEIQKQKIRDEYSKKYLEEVDKARNKIQNEIRDKRDLELKDLKMQLEEKKQQQQQFEKRELAMRKQKRELEEQAHQQKLEIERKLDIERKQISEKLEKEFQYEIRLKMLEKDKQLADTQKALVEAQRKASQGSQQNQGEVLELDFEKTLKETFKFDVIDPVGKGVNGADITQTVKNSSGITSGVILWEIKQTKNWTEKWVSKFKDDLRATKANIPVLVTTALPKQVVNFGNYHGIWVTKPEMAISLATALRNGLIDVAFERAAASGKGNKQEILYNYIASHEFRQRIEAIVEIYQEVQIQISKERAAFEKSWKQREMQMQRLIINTAGMYGEVQGLIGQSMPTIKGLEISNGKDNKDLQLF